MESNQSNAAAVRAFHVLELVAEHESGCTLSELVQETRLPRQTVHRLVGQLALSGLLIKEPNSRKVQLSHRLEHFATKVIMNGALRRERHAVLQSLVASTGETCNLTALAGTDVVYLDRVETSWQLKMSLAPGSHVPLHATSSGKVLLSMLPKAQRDRLLALLPLRAFTEHTIVDRAALATELAESRRRRIGINRAEHLRGMNGIAVPVMVGRARACAAIAQYEL
mgnify:FL=1